MSVNTLTQIVPPCEQDIKVYPRRWLILLLFVLFSTANTMQWLQYSVIENVMTRYYNVSTLSIEWLSMIYNALYVVLLVPVIYMLHKLDIRYTCIIASVVTSLGSWVKFFSISPDLYIVAFLGQALVGIWQIVALALPANVSAYWFGPDQIATATALNNSGMTLGISVFALLTPMIVKNHDYIGDIGKDLWNLSIGVAVFSTAVAVLIILFFRNEPATPPSKSRALQKLHKSQQFEFLQPVVRIIKNVNFLLLFHAHGFNIAIMNANMTLLNQLYLARFPNGEQDAGTVNMVFILIGTGGCIVFGLILDKTKKFKEVMLFLYACSLIGQILFAGALCMQLKWGVYASATFLGFFMGAYMTVGYDTCAEITYPESEGICVAILNLSNQFYGIIIIIVVNEISKVYGDVGIHVCMCCILAVGMILTVITDDVQNRQAAIKEFYQEPVPENSQGPISIISVRL